MNRWLRVCVLGCVIMGGLRVMAAPADAARAADREEAEERFRILNGTIEQLAATEADTRRRLEQLTEALQKLALESRSRPSDSQYVTRDEFNKLKNIVAEIEAKRVADQQEIKQRIESLGKTLSDLLREAAKRPTPEPQRPAASEPKPAAGGGAAVQVPQEWGVYYTVEKGNTLSAIVTAHNEQFRKQGLRTTQKLVLAANPKAKPETIYVGQKLFIPLEKIEGSR